MDRMFNYPNWDTLEGPPSPLPATSGEISLNTPTPPAIRLLLLAQKPSTVWLRGPSDLRFERLTVRLKGVPLCRNLADPLWGTTRHFLPALASPLQLSGDPAKGEPLTEYLLPGVQRIEQLGIRSQASSMRVQVRESGQWREFVTAKAWFYDSRFKGGQRFFRRAADADGVRVILSMPEQDQERVPDVLIGSDSEPYRVGIAAGDDTPLQVIPERLSPPGAGGESDSRSRDVAAELNRLWQTATPVEGQVTVPLKLNSLTDGIIELRLEGTYYRLTAGIGEGTEWVSETVRSVDPLRPQTLKVRLPEGAPSGTIMLTLTGQLTSGRMVGVSRNLPPSPVFWVRVQDGLEIAQAFHLGEAAASFRVLTGVWLVVSAVPNASQKLELRVALPEGEPAGPAAKPLASAEVELPAEADAYIADQAGRGFWLRAAFPRPVALEPQHVAGPLFLVCTARDNGILLLHRSLEDGGRLPAGGGVGTALVRNLPITTSWEDQFYNGEGGSWIFDLETEPRGTEWQSMLEVPLTHGRGLVEITGPALEGLTVSLPVTGRLGESIEVTLSSRACGELTIQAAALGSVGAAQ